MRIKGLIIFIVLSVAMLGIAETWRLGESQTWEPVSQAKDGNFMLAVSHAKMLVSTGKTSKAKKAFEKLKAEHPELAGTDYDAFVAAELLYSRRKYEAAAMAYDNFTNQFPQSPFFDSALERQQQIAVAYLGGQKKTVFGVFKLNAYEEGSEIIDKIADKAGDSPQAKNALRTLAEAREKRGAYDEAYQTWTVISDKWPTGQIGKEALLGMARSLEMDYKGPKFDSKPLESSRTYYEEYQKRYTEEAKELGVSEKLEQIDEKLAQKELAVADYYARTDSNIAANLYYQRIIKDWPESTTAKQASVNMSELEKKIEAQLRQSSKKKLNLKGLLL